MGIKNKGFTLLELILVLAIIGIILPAGFTMFVASMRAQMKVLVLQEVKRNGDIAIANIEGLIRDRALSLEQQDGTPVCATAPDDYTSGDIYFVDPEGNRFRFYIDGESIASESSAIGAVPLTSSKVSVSGFSLTCKRDFNFSPPLISLSYTVDQAFSTRRAEETASLDYLTKIRLRTY